VGHIAILYRGTCRPDRAKENDMTAIRERVLSASGRLPLSIEPTSSVQDLAAFIADNREFIANRLLDHGALLFRGFGVLNVADFDRVIAATQWPRMDYTYRSTPRTEVGNKLYTATEYPPSQQIPLHNENAYQRTWPLKLSLCCIQPAQSGGETPVADMRRVGASIGVGLLEQFQERGVRYVRHYHPRFDLSWQTAFQVGDRESLAASCAERNIQHEWLTGDVLRTTQTSQGTAVHPRTGERFYFNQAHLFHASAFGAAIAAQMSDLFGADRLPRHAQFGDGAEISSTHFEQVRAAFATEAITFTWQAGDVILLDNMQVAHGRSSYKGARKVLAALLDSHSQADPTPCTRT
jgi:alpha-ketoglutarate-dependent taurine dioxygenase